MGTGIMYMEGRWRDDQKAVEFKGSAVDPLTGNEVHMRQIYRVKDNNTHELDMYETREGKERKTMEIIMTMNK